MLKIITTFLLLILLICCGTQKTEEEIKNEKLNEEAKNLMAEALIAVQLSEWKINLDSVRAIFTKIPNDSASQKLAFAVEFDSLAKTNIEKVKGEKEALAAIEAEKNKKAFENLKRKFTYKKDEFKDIGFYTHKTWGKNWKNRCTLTSDVNSSGYVWLNSNYSREDWLFHTRIIVKIGDETIRSEEVPTYSDNHRTDNAGGRVWEVITYNDDKGILKAIAENSDKKIKVRFEGDKYYHDVTLSSKDKLALKDCYELGQLIKKMN